jgi:hypothetical protein
VHDFFGEIEVADQADQRREDPARLVAIEVLDRHALLATDRSKTSLSPHREERVRVRGEKGRYPTSITGRTSIEPIFADGTRAAMPRASSRFAAWMR